MSSVSEGVQLEAPSLASVKRKRSPMASPRSTIAASDMPEPTNHQRDLEKQSLLHGSPTSGSDDPKHEETFLYLAFGSNLAKSTFEGMRKVRPLAQVNVHAPSLELTFDLPGFAYNEPCFANSRKRVPTHSKYGAVTGEKVVMAKDEDAGASPSYHLVENLGWSKGLVGTVYEVTASDFKHILETEGAGASYENVTVQVWSIPSGSTTVPDPDSYPSPPSDLLPRIPEGALDGAVPQAFLAHTLLAPLPSTSSSLYRKPSWAQPSPRYLGLLRTGARERGLPLEYINWLDGLKPFEITTTRQKIGKYAFALFWGPFIMTVFRVTKLLTDKNGNAPRWYGAIITFIFSSAWWSYDHVFRPITGEGERTEGT